MFCSRIVAYIQTNMKTGKHDCQVQGSEGGFCRHACAVVILAKTMNAGVRDLVKGVLVYKPTMYNTH